MLTKTIKTKKTDELKFDNSSNYVSSTVFLSEKTFSNSFDEYLLIIVRPRSY